MAIFTGAAPADMKGDDATMITAFLRMKREGFRPSRDLILALTSDEESGPANGIQYLVKEHRDLIDAAFRDQSGFGRRPYQERKAHLHGDGGRGKGLSPAFISK